MIGSSGEVTNPHFMLNRVFTYSVNGVYYIKET